MSTRAAARREQARPRVDFRRAAQRQFRRRLALRGADRRRRCSSRSARVLAWRQYDDAQAERAQRSPAHASCSASDRVRHVLRGPGQRADSIAASPTVTSGDTAAMAQYFTRVQPKRRAAPALQRGPRLDRPRRATPASRSTSARRLGRQRLRPRLLQAGDGDRQAVHQQRPHLEARASSRWSWSRCRRATRAGSHRRARRGARARRPPRRRESPGGALGFQDLVLLDREGQQLTVPNFARPKNMALLERSGPGEGVKSGRHGLRRRRGPRRRLCELDRRRAGRSRSTVRRAPSSPRRGAR